MCTGFDWIRTRARDGFLRFQRMQLISRKNTSGHHFRGLLFYDEGGTSPPRSHVPTELHDVELHKTATLMRSQEHLTSKRTSVKLTQPITGVRFINVTNTKKPSLGSLQPATGIQLTHALQFIRQNFTYAKVSQGHTGP
jgi:hypothetical protein